MLRVLGQQWPEAQRVGLARHPDDLPEGVIPIAGSVEDPSTWAGHPALADIDVIIHLAAVVSHSRRDAELLHRVNVDGTLAMVELAEDHDAKMIFMSTSGTVGVFKDPESWADEHSPHAVDRVKRWPYYASKIEAERRARRRAEDSGLTLSILRPPVMLGPGDPTGRSVKHVTRVLHGEYPAVIQGGMHWVDVRHVAAAVVTTARMEAPRPVYNLPGTHTSMMAFAERVASLGHAEAPSITLPWRLVHPVSKMTRVLGKRAPLPDPVLIEMAGHWWGLRTRHAEELGWDPPDGDVPIRDTIAWLRDGATAAAR